MDLFSDQNGLTTFGIVLALATYTQAVSNRFRDAIKLNEASGSEGKIGEIKNRLMWVSLGDFFLVALGLIAGWRVLVCYSGFDWRTLDGLWGLSFAVVVTGLSCMHISGWRTAIQYCCGPRPITHKLQLPQHRGELTFTYPRDLLTAADQSKVDEWLQRCPAWTPPTKVTLRRPSLELTLSLYHTRLSPEEQTDLQQWLNSFPITMPTPQMAGEPAKT